MASRRANLSSSSPPSRTPKTMSSNLMTMKFMQRAAASQSQRQASALSTPDLSGPPSKRRKTDTRTPDYGRAEALAGTTVTPLLSDVQQMEMATAEEEARRERALERLAAEAGETKWVLSTARGRQEDEGRVILSVARAGYGVIDEGEGVVLNTSGGRRSFGRFNKELEQKDQQDVVCKSLPKSPQCEYSSDDGTGVEDGRVQDTAEDSDGDPTGARNLIQAQKGETIQRMKAERNSKRKAEKQEMARLAEKRKIKDVKWNRLSSISKKSGNGVGSGRDMSNIECFNCGDKGHEKRNCPKKAEERRGSSNNKKSGGSSDY